MIFIGDYDHVKKKDEKCGLDETKSQKKSKS